MLVHPDLVLVLFENFRQKTTEMLFLSAYPATAGYDLVFTDLL
jgi:hypothetical protein